MSEKCKGCGAEETHNNASDFSPAWFITDFACGTQHRVRGESTWWMSESCVARQLAQTREREAAEKARAEKAEQGLCGASNDLILLRERTEKVEFDCASLHLELQAEKHNHQKDNEHLLARAEKVEAWNKYVTDDARKRVIAAIGGEHSTHAIDYLAILDHERKKAEKELAILREKLLPTENCSLAFMVDVLRTNIEHFKNKFCWADKRADTAEAEAERLRADNQILRVDLETMTRTAANQGDRAGKAEAENTDYKRHLDNALRQAKEVCPDYPWSASPTMSEIAYAVCSSVQGVGLACDDWAAEAERLLEVLGHYRAKRRVDGGGSTRRVWDAHLHMVEDDWIEANDALAASDPATPEATPGRHPDWSETAGEEADNGEAKAG